MDNPIPNSQQQEYALERLIKMTQGGMDRVKNAIGYVETPGFVPDYQKTMQALRDEFEGLQGCTLDYQDGATGSAECHPDPFITVRIGTRGDNNGQRYSGIALYAIFVRMLNLTYQPKLPKLFE